MFRVRAKWIIMTATTLVAATSFAVTETTSSTTSTNGTTSTKQNDQASKVWHELFENPAVSPITSGDPGSQTTSFAKQDSAASQTPGTLVFGGFRVDGGQMWLKGSDALKSACVGEAAKNFELCNTKSEADQKQQHDKIRDWEAAALTLGIPGAALVCIAAENSKPTSKNDAKAAETAKPIDKKGPKPPEQTEAQQKANQKQFDKAREVYARLIGKAPPANPTKSDPPPVADLKGAESDAWRAASNIRQTLISYEKSVLQPGKTAVTNEDFFNLIKMVAVSQRNPDAANQMAQQMSQTKDGSTSYMNAPPGTQDYVNGVMSCICGSEKIVGAPGDCSKGLHMGPQ